MTNGGEKGGGRRRRRIENKTQKEAHGRAPESPSRTDTDGDERFQQHLPIDRYCSSSLSLPLFLGFRPGQRRRRGLSLELFHRNCSDGAVTKG